jgi:hypothetical protein
MLLGGRVVRGNLGALVENAPMFIVGSNLGTLVAGKLIGGSPGFWSGEAGRG